MRKIADKLLPAGHPPTYVSGELTSQPVPQLPPPRHGCSFHVFCGQESASALIDEVVVALRLPIVKATTLEQLCQCECFLLHLSSHTWNDASTADALMRLVLQAMDAKMPILLAHEMPGVGGQDERGGCDFNGIISATPRELLSKNIYDDIAEPLKGGAWREA